VPPDGQDADYLGYPAIAQDDVLETLYGDGIAKGWQILTHTNGDAAIDQLIRTLGPALRAHPDGDHRAVMIHGQFIRQDQLDSLAELNIIPSLFPMHTFYWGDWYDVIVGPEQAQQISPTRSALDRGMVVTSHTDAPVALPNLISILSATVNRTSRSGKIMGPDERVTPLEALRMITISAAYQHFEEHRKGSLEVGKLADLVVLSDNPLTIEPAQLNSIQVLETIKEGRSVYSRPD
jgi:predicted amidohydrolase YtcJ